MDVLISTVGVIPALISVSVLTLTVLVAKPKTFTMLKTVLYEIRKFIEDCILFVFTCSWIIFLGTPYGALMVWRFIVAIYIKIKYGPLGDILAPSDVIGVIDSDNSRQVLKSLKVMEGDCDMEDLRVRCQLSMGRTNAQGFLVYPKFHQFLSRCGGFFCWKPSNFDLEHHVRYLDGLDENSPSISEAEAMERCGKMCNEPFAAGRANWEILVIPRFHYNAEVENVENAVKKMAIFIRIHHGIGDGFSLLKFILKDMAREKEYDIPLPKKPQRSWLYAFGVALFFMFRGPRYLYWEMIHRDNNALHNDKMHISGEKCLAWSEQISVEFLKRIKTKLKSGMSTIMLSSFAGALRQYYKEIDGGKHPKQVSLVMPLPAPNHPDDRMVNKFSIILFPLTTDSDDPVERTKEIDREGRILARSPEVVMNLFLVTLAGAMPVVLARPFFENRQATVVVSNIPGPGRSIKLYNRKLVDTMFWLPHLGTSGISVSFLSYGNDLRIGLTLDKGIFPTGNEGARKILENSVKELLNLAKQIGVSTEGVVHDPHASHPFRRQSPDLDRRCESPNLEDCDLTAEEKEDRQNNNSIEPTSKMPSDLQKAILTGRKHFNRSASRQLVGDILKATAFLSYSGPFNQEYRALLLNQFTDLVERYDIPRQESCTVLSLLLNSSDVAEWTMQGLPNDELSIENAVIVTKGASYPLMVDPQSQGKAWIKAKEAKNNLCVTSLNHKYFRTHLEDSLSLGRPLLIEDVGEELDPVIDNVLEKNFIKSGTIEKVVVGDKECDVMPGFMLYITTKLANPFYTPEISAKTCIIDFTVTMKGLEDQLLGRVILMEKSELESERMALFESVMQNKRSMKSLEDSLLEKLSSSEGSLVDDEELIRVLRETKSTSQNVKTKLQTAEETDKKITIAREEFRPIASRGSVLYFLVVEMAKVNVMYQTSLKQFLNLFDGSIKTSEKSLITSERIENVLNKLNWEVWQFVQRSLFVKDRFLFTLMMTLKIDLHSSNIQHEEFMVLIKGGASLDLSAVRPKPFRWISDVSWLNLVELSKLKPFRKILDEVSEKEHDWKVWQDLETPEVSVIPCGYEKLLDSFRRLLIVRSWCPDRTLIQAKNYAIDRLGPDFGEVKLMDFEQVYSETDELTPLICLLSTGSDPTLEIENLSRGKTPSVKIVSMGQGQELFARQLITDSMSSGSWVLLQNCHLCLPFCDEIMELITESTSINPSFRLWLTTEPHAAFPIGLLHASIKFTNEPPQGIRASMRRTYQGVTQDYLEYTSSKHWPVLLYTVAFLHTIVQERRKFGSLGWNIPYEFNKADYTASVQFIQNHLEELDPKKHSISWPTVCYMLGEVQYGGRVTDDFDKRLLNTFTTSWFCESLLHGQFEFYKGYKAPTSRNLTLIHENLNNLPLSDSPQVFGLHGNADITHQINGVKNIFEAILGVQPKQSGGGGESRESVVFKLADDMLKKLPLPYVSFEVKDALTRLGALLPMNIFLRQELDRMNKVLLAVRETLCDLKLAIEGTIIMSTTLREALDAMYDAQVPPSWKRISWDSGSIGFWFTELLDRHNQFRVWLTGGKPRVFWMTGFFNPQGFLTAMRQEVTRAHKGWALDSVVLQNVVTRFWKEEINEPPNEGVYVHGLYVEGASVEKKTGKLIESRPKVLFEPVPVIFIFAVNSTSGKDPRLYECPIYRKPKRTDANYIGSIDFQTDTPPRHWILRGVALLCDIK